MTFPADGSVESTAARARRRKPTARREQLVLLDRPSQSSTMPAILLTGASRGLGLSVLTLLLRSPSLNAAGRAPPSVVTISRSLPAELEALAAEFPERLVCVQGDVVDKSVNVDAVGKAVERFGGLEAVILNAGVLDPLGKLADVDIVRPLGCSVPFSLKPPALTPYRDSGRRQKAL